MHFFMFPTIACIYTQRTQLYSHAKKLCSSLYGKIQLKLFTSEAALIPTILENKVVAEMVCFKEANIDIISFNKKKFFKNLYPYSSSGR